MTNLRSIVLGILVSAPALALAQPTPPDPASGALPDPAVTEPDATEPAVAESMPAPMPIALPPPADDHAVHVKYDKGLTFESADEAYELKLGIRSQFRFEAVRADVADPAKPEFAARFSVPRLRLQVEGHAFGKPNGYKVEFDMANKGFALLKDFYVDHAFSKALHLRGGQWKRPFNRQEITSDFGSEFLERSLANEFVGGGRDLGVAVHNDYEKSPEGVEWALGVFNATGEKASLKTTCAPGATPTDPLVCTTGVPTNLPGDFGPALVAHVGWNSGGIKGYSEGDLEGGALRYAVAASYRMNPRDFDKVADKLNIEHAVVIDAVVKLDGLGVSGAFMLVKNGQADPEVGFYGEAGYMLMPKKLLGSVRFAQVPAADDKKYEVLGALNWLWQGHNLKAMIDGGVIHTTGVGTNDLQIRTQLQMVL